MKPTKRPNEKLRYTASTPKPVVQKPQYYMPSEVKPAVEKPGYVTFVTVEKPKEPQKYQVYLTVEETKPAPVQQVYVTVEPAPVEPVPRVYVSVESEPIIEKPKYVTLEVTELPPRFTKARPSQQSIRRLADQKGLVLMLVCSPGGRITRFDLARKSTGRFVKSCRSADDLLAFLHQTPTFE